MNPRSDCTSATMNACLMHWKNCGISVIRFLSWSTTKKPFAAPTTLSTLVPAPDVMAANWSRRGRRQDRKDPSLTGAYISGRKKIAMLPIAVAARYGDHDSRARENNLKNLDVVFPSGCDDGGDRSFGLRQVHTGERHPLPCAGQKTLPLSRRGWSAQAISGAENIDKVIRIDQSPIGRTPRSNPATYTGVFTQIRDLYAMLPESRERGYKAGRFSFNVSGGRCEACQGEGQRRIEMNFLPDVYVVCEVCGGRRYNHETLAVKYKGHSIADLLETPYPMRCRFWRTFRRSSRSCKH